MKKITCEFELIKDAAPHQFADAGDAMMIYHIKHMGYYITGTEDYHLEDLVEYCKVSAKFFEKTAAFLAKKEQHGDRCT